MTDITCNKCGHDKRFLLGINDEQRRLQPHLPHHQFKRSPKILSLMIVTNTHTSTWFKFLRLSWVVGLWCRCKYCGKWDKEADTIKEINKREIAVQSFEWSVWDGGNKHTSERHCSHFLQFVCCPLPDPDILSTCSSWPQAGNWMTMILKLWFRNANEISKHEFEIHLLWGKHFECQLQRVF